MKLSIVIPCYNEYKTVATLLNAVKNVAYVDKEIIVIDDFSSDGTRELLLSELSEQVDQLVLHDSNQGKGAAVRSGIEIASGDIILIQDADLEYDPKDYTLLLAPILNGQADVVYGSRYLGKRPHTAISNWQRINNKVITVCCNLVTKVNLTDAAVCYKVFRTEVLRSISLKENRFGFDFEITIKADRNGARFREVGISYNGRSHKEGKKIGWRDGIRVLYSILKYGVFRH